MSELKPCPFCGGEAHIRKDWDEDGCIWVYVKCGDCGCRTKGKWVSCESNACNIFYSEVKEAWNRRAE